MILCVYGLRVVFAVFIQFHAHVLNASYW